MRNSHGKDLLRAQVNSSWLYRIFNIVFVVLFALIILLAIFFNQNQTFSSNFLLLLAAAAVGTLVVFLVSRLFSAMPRPGPIAERIIVIVLLALLFGVQVYIGWNILFKMGDSSDYGHIFSAARDFVNGRPDADSYFLLYPRNAGLYVLWCGLFSIFSLFGQTEFLMPAMVFNAAAITASVLLLFLCVRRMFGSGKSIFILVASFFILPFAAGAALPCAETLVLPICTAAVMMWMRARNFWRQGEIKKAVIRVCTASALLGVGALFKMAVLVIWIAIAIDMLVLLCGKGRLRLLLASFLSVAVIFFALTLAIWMSPLLPAYSGSERVPETAYVLAGLEQPGGGAAALKVLEDEEDAVRRSIVAREKISGQMRDMGAGGFVVHLMEKLSYTFGDGSYSLAEEYNQAPSSVFKVFLAHFGANHLIIAYIAFAVMAGTMVWMVVGALKSVFRANDAFTFLRVAIFGLTLFLMIWDAGPRSLICLLPLMLLCGLEAAPVPVARKPVPTFEDPEHDGPPESNPLRCETTGDGKMDYMDPGFGLVREDVPVGAVYQAKPITSSIPVEEIEIPQPTPGALPSPQMPPQRPEQAGSLWDFMENE